MEQKLRFLWEELGSASSNSRSRAVRPIGWMGVGWAAIGLGNSLNDGAYSKNGLALVVLGAAAIVIGVLPPAARMLIVFDSVGTYFALLSCGIVAFLYPAGIYGSGRLLATSRLLTVAGLLVAGGGVAFGRARQIRGLPWFTLVLSVAVASATVMVEASPHPAIDVWYMDQDAATALLHGHNFYTLKWTSGIQGELSNHYAYLPGAVLLQAPLKWVCGDVRFALVGALALASVCVYRMSRGPRAWLLAGLIVLSPKMTFGVEQGWIDPLLLALTVATVLAVQNGHTRWAILTFAAALSCKQYEWLFIPAAAAWGDFGVRRTVVAMAAAGGIILPWVLASPSAFWQGAFAYNLTLPPRLDSLSLYSLALRHSISLGYGFMIVVAAGAVLLSVWLARSGSGGFLVGTGLAMAGFDLASKLAFFNEWSLAASLIAGGTAVWATTSESPRKRNTLI